MRGFDLHSNNKRETKKNTTGNRIRSLRNAKKMTAAELGQSIGLAENSIRNYENGSRQVSEEKLLLIAQSLGVPVESLLDRKINSHLDVIHILFELSDTYELVPTMLPQEPKYAILTKNKEILYALQEWYEKRRLWEQGRISQSQYQDWMNSFPLYNNEESQNYTSKECTEHLYTDFERILGLKSAIESLSMIVDTKVSECAECLKAKDYRLVQKKLSEMQSTIQLLTQMDIKKFG